MYPVMKSNEDLIIVDTEAIVNKFLANSNH